MQMVALGTALTATTWAQVQVGTIQDPAIVESSGLVASRRYPGVFWTHNDSGSAPVIFAINQRGQALGRFPVQRVSVVDLEDIAIDGNGRLYLADIGADGRSRDRVAVYRIREPNPRGTERRRHFLGCAKGFHACHPHFFESHFLIPLINRQSVELPPAVTLISLVALGTLFGFLGMLLATPLAAAFLVLVRRDYVEGVLERRHQAREGRSPA